jgi:SagB-type dehydrogenase family enzyme
LLARRTTRVYGRRVIDATTLSAVLFHGFADVRARRSLPIKDELDYLGRYGVAFDIFVVVYPIEGLDPGVYFYGLEDHVLDQRSDGDYREAMVEILCGMKSPETASWTIVLTVDFPRYQWRYRHERALRHLYMASGRIAQRVLLVAQAYGLGTLTTPATMDRACCALLALDCEREAPIYTLTMGPFPGRSSQPRR